MADNLLSLKRLVNKIKTRKNMLITLITAMVIALLFGKITIKEIKNQ